MQVLRTQYDGMFQEVKNQNHGILKHADHSRILSEKVSKMAGEIKTLRQENAGLREKVELVDLKHLSKLKKLKTKMSNVQTRLDRCSCPQLNEDEMVTINPIVAQRELEKKKREMKKMLRKKMKKEERRQRKSKRRKGKNRRKENKQKKIEKLKRKSMASNINKANNLQQAKTKLRNSKKNKATTGGPSLIFVSAGSTNATELVDMDRMRDHCSEDRVPYPLKVRGAVGTFIEGQVLICGGRTSIEDYHNDCYRYNDDNNLWEKSQGMREKRFQASAVMIDSRRWWVTGGFSGEHVYNNTEVYEPGKGFRAGPQMPMVTFQHCLVKVNATHVFSVGGFPYNSNAWLLDFDRERYTAVSPIAHLRDAPHCAKIERNNGNVEVVVAGGSLPGSELSTEIYSVTYQRWRKGPKLPQAVIYGVSLAFKNTLLILGGHQMGDDLEELDTIFQYDPVLEKWDTLRKHLGHARTSFVAVLLPEYYRCTSAPPLNTENGAAGGAVYARGTNYYGYYVKR